MTHPYQPPMVSYTVFFRTAGVVRIVTSRPLDLDGGSEWLVAKEYHVNVHKYGWNTMLKEVRIKIKEIAYIECEGYIKPPLAEEVKE